MTRRRRDKKRKGIPPVFAAVALIGSAGYLAQSIWSLYAKDVYTGPGTVERVSEAEETPEASKAIADHEVGDLLKAFGSYDENEPIRWAFNDVGTASDASPAPTGEVAPVSQPIWLGDDPPSLRLSLVMVSAGSRQAVLGNDLVGVGEECSGGTVVSIEPGVVVLRWRQMDLTYELNRDIAVEFRDEWSRRQLGKTESSQGGSGEGDK
jgi:hypothetical protein